MEDSFSSSLSSSGGDLASTACHQASKYFVNKRFPESFETLQPLIKADYLRRSGQIQDKTWCRCWKLYIALIDTAAKQGPLTTLPQSALWPKKVRKELISKISSGDLIEQVKQAFAVKDVPLDVAVGLVNLYVKHQGDVDRVSQFVEEYLSSISDRVFEYSAEEIESYEKLLHLFVYRVLPARQEFDYAREFVQHNEFFDPAERPLMVEKINSLETTYHDDIKKQKQEEQRRQALEVERVAKAEHKELENSVPDSQCEKISPASSKSTSPTPPRASPRIPTQNPRPTLTRVHDWNSIKQYWSYRIMSLNTSNLLSILLFVAAIFLTFSNPASRARLKRTFSTLWAKIIATIAMAVKVNYI